MPAAADKGRNLFTPLTSVHVTEFSFAVLSYSATAFSPPVYISIADTRAHAEQTHAEKSLLAGTEKPKTKTQKSMSQKTTVFCDIYFSADYYVSISLAKIIQKFRSCKFFLHFL